MIRNDKIQRLSLFFVCTLVLVLPACSGSLTPSPIAVENTESANQVLLFSCTDGKPYCTDAQDGVIDRILISALSHLNIQMNVIPVTSERALQNANTGISDGDYLRIEGLESIYPNLVRVPEPLIEMEFVGFTKRPDLQLNGWDSLQPYNVGIITGWKIFEENVPSTRSLIKVRDPDSLFSLLEKDRADIVLYSRLGGQYLLHERNLKEVRAITPPLKTEKMYLYLNQKHQALVTPLAETLQTMKANGEYNRFFSDISFLN